MEFLVETDKKVYEISELVKSVTFTDKLNDGCSKLEFSYADDELKISNGSTVSFKFDNLNIFYGYVFKHSQNRKNEITVTAYDQLRYCKAKDSFISNNATITTLVNRMCNNFGLKKGILTDTKYKLTAKPYDNTTWLDIIYSAISDTLMSTGKKYVLRDEFGSIAVRDLEDLQLNLVLGDKSFVYDYDYEKSIDDKFYNLIKIQVKKDSKFIESKDINSINKYGLLQYFEVTDNENSSQAKLKTDTLLRLYNREAESLNLKCLGDTRVRAGSSFYGQIGDIGLNKRLIVKSVTHNFLPVHTMTLEVVI